MGSIREMDELLFEIPELVDYCVKIVDGKKEITALFTSDNGEERIRSVLEEKDIRSWNCRKVKWEDLHCILANELQGSDFVVSWNHCLVCYSE